MEETYKRSDEEISEAPITMNNNIQATMLKSIVLDSGWFDGNRTKFENWWRGIQLFLKSNRIIETNNRITVILAYLRGGIADIYAQKKLDELNKELGIQDWKEFIKEIKTTFSDKMKTADAKWRIESFEQEKKNIVDFIIEFEALVMKADTDELYAIFLLKNNI